MFCYRITPSLFRQQSFSLSILPMWSPLHCLPTHGDAVFTVELFQQTVCCIQSSQLTWRYASACLHVHVCACACLPAHACLCMPACACLPVPACMRLPAHLCMPACLYVCLHVPICACLSAPACLPLCLHACMPAYLPASPLIIKTPRVLGIGGFKLNISAVVGLLRWHFLF